MILTNIKEAKNSEEQGEHQIIAQVLKMGLEKGDVFCTMSRGIE